MVGGVIPTSILALTVVQNIEHECNYCGQYFHLEILDQHKQRECKDRQVKCPYFKCGAMVSLFTLKDRLVNRCVRMAKIKEGTMPCQSF